MIKNIIFDLGNTVLRFDPREITKNFYYTMDRNFDILTSVTFARKFWDKCDSGEISQEAFKNAIRDELPDNLHKYSDKICDFWYEVLPVIDGMEELIDELKGHGYRVFALSNISKHFSENRRKIPILSKFEKMILSADYGIVKPDKEIYKLAISEFSVKPEETLFADDSKINIDAAEKLGIHGYIFDGDAAKLKDYILSIQEAQK